MRAPLAVAANGGVPCGTDVITPTYACAILASTSFVRGHHADHHRVRARDVPRGGVVNARRPGHRPGRSEAKSIDDAEHGASMKDAMVRRQDLDPQNATFLPGKHGTRANRFLFDSSAALFRRIWTRRRARGRRVRPARTVRADSDMRHDQRWRERPRLDGLGSLARQDSGVVHAIVGSATATPAPVATAAQSAASMTCSRQVAAIETLAHGSRSWGYQG